MRAKHPLVLLAVAVTFASANHETPSQTTDSDKATKLIPANTTSASPATGIIQPDRARSLRNFNITATQTAEERVPVSSLADWEDKLFQLARTSSAVRTIHMKKTGRLRKSDAEWKQHLTEQEKHDLKMRIEALQPDSMTRGQVFKELRKKVNFTALKREAVHAYLDYRSLKSYVKMTNDIKKCAREQCGVHNFKDIMRTNMKNLANGDGEFIDSYYAEQVEEMEKEVLWYFEQGISMDNTIAAMNREGDGAVTKHIQQLYVKQYVNAQIAKYRTRVEEEILRGAETNEIVMKLNPKKIPGENRYIRDCITMWHNDRDAKVTRKLKIWLVAGESQEKIYERLKSPNIPDLLNKRDQTTFWKMRKNREDLTESLFEELYLEDTQPVEVAMMLGAMNGVNDSPVFRSYEIYRKLYEDNEKKLTEWMDAGMTPLDVSRKLDMAVLKRTPIKSRLDIGMYKKFNDRWEAKHKGLVLERFEK